MKKTEISNYIKELVLKGDIETFEKKIKLKSFTSVIQKPYKVTGGGRNYEYFSIMYPDLVKFSGNVTEHTIDMLYQLYNINPDYIEFYRDSEEGEKIPFKVLKFINSSDKMIEMVRHIRGEESEWMEFNNIITKSILFLKKEEILYLLNNSKLIDTRKKDYPLFNGYDEYSKEIFKFFKRIHFSYEEASLFNKKCINSELIEVILQTLYDQPLEKRDIEQGVNQVLDVIYYNQDVWFSDEQFRKIIGKILASTKRIDINKVKFISMKSYKDYDNFKDEVIYSVMKQLPEFNFLFQKEKLNSEEYTKIRNFAHGDLIPFRADLSSVYLKEKGITVKSIEVFGKKHRRKYIGIFQGNGDEAGK